LKVQRLDTRHLRQKCYGEGIVLPSKGLEKVVTVGLEVRVLPRTLYILKMDEEIKKLDFEIEPKENREENTKENQKNTEQDTESVYIELKEPKEKTKTIVAVSGYFDPLHVGHIDYLKGSKRLGDHLVVIINNDRQTKNKKGYVFMPAEEKAKIILELGFVDEVFISIDEDGSVCESLRAVKPHIFTQGGDRFNTEVPEAVVCKEIGIKMIDCVGKKIQSSSELVEKAEKQKLEPKDLEPDKKSE